jgi:riboflavin kinase/FMN adenylyltransferase
MNFREKIRAFQKTEIDYVLCIRFESRFAALTAEQFVQQILVDGLNVKHLVVGDDFHFGKQRSGDFAYLQAQGEQSDFTVTDMPTYNVDGKRVSSTRVRRALAKPDLERAEALLGSPFKFSGRVIHGQKLGRTIGFPTLNLNPKRLQMPVQGVFAVTVDGIADKPWPGVANLGIRPTVNGQRPSIEVHLFDWADEIYGQHVDVTLQHYIRPELKFESIEALTEQIRLDAKQARQYFTI